MRVHTQVHQRPAGAATGKNANYKPQWSSQYQLDFTSVHSCSLRYHYIQNCESETSFLGGRAASRSPPTLSSPNKSARNCSLYLWSPFPHPVAFIFRWQLASGCYMSQYEAKGKDGSWCRMWYLRDQKCQRNQSDSNLGR
jgi:hypothetical protein